MALRPLEDIIGPLIVPVRGKEYTLPAVSLSDGLKIHASRNKGELLMSSDLYRIILGDVHTDMLTNNVPGDVIDRVFLTAYTDFTSGRDSAEEVWENGIPKALREAAKEVLKTLPGGASMTPPPASGNGTTSPKAKATRSRGSKSSITSPSSSPTSPVSTGSGSTESP
jgi:hypothetical protein